MPEQQALHVSCESDLVVPGGGGIFSPRGSESRAGRKVWVLADGAASEAGNRGAPGEHVWRLAHVGASWPSLARAVCLVQASSHSRALGLLVLRLPCRLACSRALTAPILGA